MWIAMEYVERREPGEGDRADRHRRHARLAVRVPGRHPDRPCWRLAFEKQIIHRNIKPANILIRKADNVAKLGDLMLAKGLSELSVQQITKPGQMVGDLAYMSPSALARTPARWTRAPTSTAWAPRSTSS